MPELREIVARLCAILGERDGDPVPLEGGITNRNFKITLGGRDYVIRMPGKDTGLLGIDRLAERTANEAAAALGIAPPVVAMFERPDCLVTVFVEGGHPSAEELRSPELVGEVAAALRAFHDAGTELSTTFSPFRVVERYAELAGRHGVPLPEGYAAARKLAKRIERSLDGPEHRPVACHNDLLAANFLRGERLSIIDWEYAGMGDRYFDLGNFAVNNELGDRDEQRLLEAYWGEPATARRRAELRLMRFMSDFREAMWGVAQMGISEIDFDFEGYASEHFGRLADTGGDPRFKALLKEYA